MQQAEGGGLAPHASNPLAEAPPTGGALFIVLNEGSGHDDAQVRREQIALHLNAAGRPFELLPVEAGRSLDEVTRQAVQRAAAARGVVVAAGGDGTINAVAQQVHGSGLAFGVLPQGTFNYFGRAHGSPEATDAALGVLLAGHAAPVQVGLVNQRVFLVNASLGLYPQLLEDREAYKARFGRSRGVALLAGVMSLLQAHRQLRLRVAWCSSDSGEAGSELSLRTPTLFVCNNRLQLEQIGITDASALDRGLLVAIALRPVGTLAMLGLLLRGALGHLGEADQVLSGAFHRMTVSLGPRWARRRIKVAADGEVSWQRAPLQFSVAAQALWLLQPEPKPVVPATSDAEAA